MNIKKQDKDPNKEFISWNYEKNLGITPLFYELSVQRDSINVEVKPDELLYLIVSGEPKLLQEGCYYIEGYVKWICFTKKAKGSIELHLSSLISSDNYQTALSLSLVGTLTEPGKIIEPAFKMNLRPLKFLSTQIAELLKPLIKTTNFHELITCLNKPHIPEYHDATRDFLRSHGFELEQVKMKTLEGKPIRGLEKLKHIFQK